MSAPCYDPFPMASDLYQSAVASLLEKERNKLTSLEVWLQDLREISGAPCRGDQILANLQSESHLLGDRTWSDSAELTEFLRDCAREHAKGATDTERQTGYESSCTSWELRGLPIERRDLPSRLLRYSRSEKAARAVVKGLGDRATQNLDQDLISLDEALILLSSSQWDSSRMAEEDRLAGGRAVFATFEHPAGAPRDIAQSMAEALALPGEPRKKEILLEFSYSRDAVANHRFPTVADAGRFHQFQPAPEVAPDPARPETRCGRTKPLGDWPAQPELVHENGSLRILDRRPRFLGRWSL